jgi:hypothetical protein
MVYEADTLKELLRLNWTLTGLMAAEGTAAANKTIRPIKFFARDQNDEKIETKAIEVHKESPLGISKANEFFSEDDDEIKIRVLYKLQDLSKDDWDLTESNVEDIEQEVERILATTFNPQTGIGIWFTKSESWRDVDEINRESQEPILVRELTIRLTRIVSRDTGVFDSFQRGVFFDLSASSNLNTPPIGDFNYTEVYDITDNEGFDPRELAVTNHPDGKGVKIFYAGSFAGNLIMSSKLKAADIGTTSDKINQIKNRQSNGEYIEAVIVSTYTNNASQTLTMTRFIHVIDVRVVQGMSNLLEWQITAKIIKPSLMAIS